MPSNAHEPFSFVQAEHDILQFWEQKGIFAKSLEQTRDKAPYVFYDGPPFATGLPHHGHLLASTLKDIIPRYFAMKGHFVQRRFGWDCHGLPIEHEIDKKLGMNTQDAVKKLGIKGYNDQCRSIVQKYAQEWQKTITRLGRWVDFDNDYKTMDANFMESVWWVLKQLWNRDLLYRGDKVVPFSPRLQTVLSNFEAGLDYRDVQDPAITVLFKLREEEAFMAAWTTTPWTLPSNLTLCVGHEIDYVKVRDEDLGKNIYLAQAALDRYGQKRRLTPLSQCKGRDLQGRSYHPVFDYFLPQKEKGAFQVLADDYVSTKTGTGIVHQAPAFGEDDNRVMKEAGLTAFACPVDETGCFTQEVHDFSGQEVKAADKGIIQKLKEKGQLYEQSTYVHSYPFCYRSGTPLIYKAIPCWYMKVSEMREELLKSNAQINWVPGHLKKGRFGKWLANAQDWAISRNRVWGTPIPIWCNDETGQRDCFGSRAELETASGVKLNDLHREYVDSVTYTKVGEAGTYRRIPEVLDCWFESGAMPYAQSHYPFSHKDDFEKGFPAEFIAEGLDQTRGWFYTLTVLSTALFQKPAFKNVIVNGLVLASDSKKMSKSLRNFTPPDELMETYGADALRLYLIHSGLVKAEEQQFNDKGVKDMVRRVLLPWYNSFKFFQTYAQVDGWNSQDHLEWGDNITDRWILSKLQTLTQKVSQEMESYQLYNVIPALFSFIDDQTNWYIRLNRRRFWEKGPPGDKNQAYSTLFTTLKQLSTLMAPFAPFLSDTLFKKLAVFDKALPESVHLCPYPQADTSKIDQGLEDAVGRMKQIILLGRQKRNQAQVKVKIPLPKLSILHRNPKVLKEIAKLETYIKSELNIKELHYAQDEENYINLFAKPNAPILGKKLGKDFALYQKMITDLSTEQCIGLESGKSILLGERKFSPEEILIFREAKKETHTLSNWLISITMNCELNDNLIQEGWAREVVNRIQKTRKNMNLNVSDRITVEFTAPPSLVSAIKKHHSYISQETLATKLVEASGLENPHIFDVDQNELKIKINGPPIHSYKIKA